MVHSVTNQMNEGIVDEIDHVAVDLGILPDWNKVDHSSRLRARSRTNRAIL